MAFKYKSYKPTSSHSDTILHSFVINSVHVHKEPNLVIINYSTEDGIGSRDIDMNGNITEQVRSIAKKVTNNPNIQIVIDPKLFYRPLSSLFTTWVCENCKKSISSHNTIYVSDRLCYCTDCKQKSVKYEEYFVWATRRGESISYNLLKKGEEKDDQEIIKYRIYYHSIKKAYFGTPMMGSYIVRIEL